MDGELDCSVSNQLHSLKKHPYANWVSFLVHSSSCSIVPPHKTIWKEKCSRKCWNSIFLQWTNFHESAGVLFPSSCPERSFIQRGLIGITGTEYLAIHHLEGRLKILRSQLLVSSRRMVLLQTIIWYSTSRPFQQVSYFKSSQSSQNVSTLPTILLIFFLTVLWWNKLRKIGFIFCNHPILWWSAHWWIWLGLLNLWSPIRKFNLLHSLLSAFTQIFADR